MDPYIGKDLTVTVTRVYWLSAFNCLLLLVNMYSLLELRGLI